MCKMITIYTGMIMVCWLLLATTLIKGQRHKTYVGCFVDNEQDQKWGPVLTNQTNLTIEICVQRCYTETNPSRSNMTYAALSNGRRCICRNNSGRPLRDRNCNVKCSGDPVQFCGGNSADKFYSLYTVCPVGYFGQDCDKLCHCKRRLPCNRKTGICSDGCDEHWTGTNCHASNVQNQFIGCFGDGQPGNRSMEKEDPGGETGATNRNTNSNEFCIDICSRHHYTYAGMQYGYHCFCGEKYDRYGNKTYNGLQAICKDPARRCPANQNQNCGGSFANSVYRVCPVGFYGPGCINRCHCADGGSCRFNGTCLTTTLRSCKPGWTGSACDVRDCRTNNGDCEPDEKCESVDLGYANLSMCRCKDGSYIDNNTCRLTSLQYVGCYQGNTTQHMNVSLPTNDTLTIEFCILKCKQLNKTYSLLQGGTKCFCGDDYGKISPDAECQIPCVGDELQYCGGAEIQAGKNAIDGTSIYVVYGEKSFLRQYIGCYKDTQSKAMPFKYQNIRGNTIDTCIMTCRSLNYTYAGLQYGYDCNCGNAYDKYGSLSESSCNMTCTGNRRKICGGDYANSVYAVNDILRCSSDADCNRNEFCNVIDLKYTNVSRCRCRQGYHRMNTWEYCADVDECISGTSSCDATSENCVNSNGSYSCECKNGFVNMSGDCIDIDECKRDSLLCDNETEICNNTNGSYICQCKPGYENSTLGNCTDIDECEGHVCDNGTQHCNNTIGSYICRCNSGYENTTFGNCTDVDECKSDSTSSSCDLQSEYCLNVIGSYTCSSKQDSAQSAVVISVVCLLVVFAIVVVALVLFLRKRVAVKKENGNSKPLDGHSNHFEVKATDGIQETSLYSNVTKQVNDKIPVGDLPALFKAKKSRPGTLEKEFKSVPVDDSTKTCREGKKKELKHRNRFQNIIPYDQNRVILHHHQDKFSDYINASFIKSYNSEEKLIATQGPNGDTLTDFWQMIHENNVGTIVMITNLVENAKKKCACYWPESDSSDLTFDDMTIALKFTESWPNYVIRHLQLIKGSTTMDVKQWHFTVWPDHGVPSDVKGFLNFRRNVRQSMSLDKYTVVHCSAGVGRTGTFIAINYLLEQAETEEMVDVVGCLTFLRQQRTQMVQTLDQYEFIYAALATEFTIGNTVINADDFNRTFKNLLVRNKLSGNTQLEIQFQVLQEQCAQQVESENPCHVFAKSLDMCEISEADQAVFVQSWKTKDAYIVSDYPDKATVNYFWTICFDFECRFIIYLDNDQTPLFFPTQPAEWLSIGSWSLQCRSSSSDHYGTRLNVDFTHISESEYSNEATSSIKGQVTLLNVKAYMNDTRLNYDAIHATYNAIKTLESKNGVNKSTNPIVIVSRPNCALSGLFVAAFNAFDMLDGAKEVDLYQVVCDIKKSRSKLFPSLATYEELHNIVNHRIEYTSSASVYSNA